MLHFTLAAAVMAARNTVGVDSRTWASVTPGAKTTAGKVTASSEQ